MRLLLHPLDVAALGVFLLAWLLDFQT